MGSPLCTHPNRHGIIMLRFMMAMFAPAVSIAPRMAFGQGNAASPASAPTLYCVEKQKVGSVDQFQLWSLVTSAAGATLVLITKESNIPAQWMAKILTAIGADAALFAFMKDANADPERLVSCEQLAAAQRSLHRPTPLDLPKPNDWMSFRHPGTLPSFPVKPKIDPAPGLSPPSTLDTLPSFHDHLVLHNKELVDLLRKYHPASEIDFSPISRPAIEPNEYFSWSVCNKTSETAWVATARKEAPGSDEYVADGWSKVSPGDCYKMDKIPRGNFYWYAEDNESHRWSGNGNSTKDVCVGVDDFHHVLGHASCGTPKRFREEIIQRPTQTTDLVVSH